MNIKPLILSALSGLCDNVFYFYPDDFAALPAISYFEEKHEPLLYADDIEYSAISTVAVDVWAEKAGQCGELAEAAIAAMGAAGFGFAESFDADTEDGIRHKGLRFVKIIYGDD